jgi:hypothetical protein
MGKANSWIRSGLFAALTLLFAPACAAPAPAEPATSSVEALAEALVRRLCAHFPLYQDRVLRVSAGEVYLQGETPPEGMKMKVFQDAGPIEDPRTFEEVGREVRPVGLIEILESSGDIAIGKILESTVPIAPGDTASSGGRPLRFALLHARPDDPDSTAAFRVFSGILPYRLERTGRFEYRPAGRPPFPPGFLFNRDPGPVRSFLLGMQLDFILNLYAVRSPGRLTLLCEVVSSGDGLPSDIFTVETPVDVFLWNYLSNVSGVGPDRKRAESLKAEWMGNVKDRILASAAWDIDGDGRDELFLLEPGSVACVALEGKGLKEIGRIDMGAWDPNPVRSRNPAGVLQITRLPGSNDAGLLIASNALRTGYLVRWRGKKAEPLPGQPVALFREDGKTSVLLDRFLPGQDVFSGEVSVLELSSLESRPCGRQLRPYLKIRPSTGSDFLLLGEGGELEVLSETLESKGRIPGLSGTVFLSAPDIFLTTSGNPPGEPDVLTIFSSQRNLRDLRVEFKSSILSACEGDLDGDGARELFVAEDTGAEGTALKVFSLPPPIQR